MKWILLIVTMSLSTLAFGQEKANVVAKYKKTERIGNFITRWYYDIIGTSLLFKEELVLLDDSTYRYLFNGGECGTVDVDQKGEWTISYDTLFLECNQNLMSQFYRISDNKLYVLSEGKYEWALKKVRQ